MPPPALRAALGRRAAASASPAPIGRPAVIGARVDTSTRYTETGGSGADSTAPSRDAAHRAARVHALYRAALRAVPEALVNFTIVEEPRFVRGAVRDMFEARRGALDGRVLDMLIFKGVQELEEVRMQFKSRTYVTTILSGWHEKRSREAVLAAAGGGDGRVRGAEAQRRGEMLAAWKARGLVPAEVLTWAQYERWKADESAAFAQFAVDGGLFGKDVLERNDKLRRSQCAIM